MAETFPPSPHQKRIFDFIETETGNGIVRAVAGSGKSTTLLMATERMSEAQRSRTLILAFNKAIATELKAKVPRGVTVSTSHSLGMDAVKRHFDLRGYNSAWVDEYKTGNLVKFYWAYELGQNESNGNEAQDAARELMRLCMLTLTDPQDIDALRALAGRYEVPLRREDEQTVFDALPILLRWDREGLPKPDRRGKRYHPCDAISFDDMLYLPCALGLLPRQFDWVFVDECQDLSAAQLALSQKAVAPGGRTLYVGDPHQAIYAFIGADAHSYAKIQEQTKAKPFELSVCYRCPRAVVAEAKRLQPQIEACKTAREGAVCNIGETAALKALRVGDAVLCRVNAPLVSVWFELLGRDIPAQILGREIEKQILATLATIEGYDRFTFEDFPHCAEAYRAHRMMQLEAQNGTEAQKISLNDQVAALQELYTRSKMRGAVSLDDVRRRIGEMFAEGQAKVVLSSIHKAKGREWNRVFLFKPELLPHPMAASDDAQEQERNLEYVAITRAQETFFWVKGEAVAVVVPVPPAPPVTVTAAPVAPAVIPTAPTPPVTLPTPKPVVPTVPVVSDVPVAPVVQVVPIAPVVPEPEAETVRPQTGMTLAWDESAGGKNGPVYAETPTIVYRAYSERRWFSRVYFASCAAGRGVKDGLLSPHKYKYLWQAKAACEQHYATGNWD